MPSTFQNFLFEPLQIVDGGTGTNSAESILTSLNAGGGIRNRIINGEFIFNNRNASSRTDATYGPDRFYFLTQTGTISYVVAPPLFSITPNQRGYLDVTNTAGVSQRFGIAQIIENRNCADLQSSRIHIKGTVQMTSYSGPIRWAVLEWPGAVDAVTTDVVNNWASTNYTPGNFFIGTVVVRATDSFTPTLGVVTEIPQPAIPITTGQFSNLILFIWTQNQVANAAGTNLFWDIALERGSVVTPYERRPVSLERSLCDYYLANINVSAINNVIGSGFIQTGTTGTIWVRFPRVRSPVTGLNISAANHFTIISPALTQAATTLVFGAGAQDGASMTFTAAGAFTANQPAILVTNNAGANLTFGGAEL